MFPVNYNIDLLLNYCYNKRRGIKLKASLECKESLYVLKFKAESDDSNIISLDSRDMVSSMVKHTFRIYKAFIGDKEVKVEWGNAIITKINTLWKQGESYTEWSFTINSFVVKTPITDILKDRKVKTIMFLSKNKFIRSNLKLKASDKDTNRNVYIPQYYTFRGLTYGLFHNIELDYPQLFPESDDNINLINFLKCVSFYYGCEIQVWLQEEIREDNIVYSYSHHTVIPSDYKRPHVWNCYKTASGGKITLELFISSLNNVLCYIEEERQLVLFKSLRSFTNSINVTNQHKLTDYCSIILSLAQFMHSFPHCQDIELAKAINKEVGIDFNKVNGELCNEGITRTNKDEDKDESINNYIELRNEVEHGLPSDKIIDFLNNSFLVDRLEHATFITILYECGIKDLQYCWYFQEFNVLI